jgi:endogenous inhibitor of DNA gyrase (YacG/DUF329 family)
MMKRSVNVMRGSDGKSHLLTWNGKGHFRPFCCSVKKARAINIDGAELDSAIVDCPICGRELEQLKAFWEKVDDHERKEEVK